MIKAATYRCAPSQRRLWERQELTGVPTDACFAIRVEGSFETDRFAAALQAVAARHPILRTRLARHHGRRWPVQIVEAEQTCIQWTHRRLLEACGMVTMVLPAACADVPSLVHLFHELASAYESAGQDSDPLQFAQFADWQLELTEKAGEDAHVPSAPPARLAWERASPDGQHDDRCSVRVPIDEESLGRLSGASLSRRTALLTVWSMVLSIFSDNSKWGCAVFDEARVFPELAQTLGPLGRYADISTSVPASATFSQAAALVQAALDRAEASPWLAPPRETAGFDYFVMPPPRAVGSASWTIADAHSDMGWFKLRLRCREGAPLVVSYDPVCLEHALVQSIAETLAKVVRGAVADTHAPLLDVARIDPGRRHARAAASEGAAIRGAGETLLSRLAGVAKAHPDAIAVESTAGAWTYAELDIRLGRLADGLAALGIRPEVAVAVDISASPQHLLAALAVMRAGGVYVPISPEDPPARLAAMLDSARVELVLVADALADAPAVDRATVSIDELERLDPHGRAASCPHADSLAYCMFTSGSTGTPKGVAVSHAALLHYLDWAAQTYFAGRAGRAVVHTATTVDLTLTSLLAPLLVGGTVAFAPPVPASERLTSALQHYGAPGLVKLTPTHLRLLSLQHGPRHERRLSDVLVIGGEMLDFRDVDAWRAADPGMRIYNEYGPTETTVGCCVEEIGPVPESGLVPIGRAIDGATLRILDRRLEPVPLGVAGELFIGGSLLARGYCGRPAETAAVFVPDPFGPPGARLYRTGDVARLRPDGRLDLLGRRDGQIKIRGYRVELAEIETALRRHPAVADAVALATGSDGMELGAVVARADEMGVLDADDIRGHLLGLLPHHMVPTKIAVVDRLPSERSGKADRRALVALLAGPIGGEPPTGEAEEILAGIWSDILGNTVADANANFFTIGGDSIRAIQVIGRARARGLHLSVEDVFSTPTVRGLAARTCTLAETRPMAPFALLDIEERLSSPRGVIDGFPAAALQQGMLFHNAMECDAGVYHDLFSFHLAAPFDRPVFERALADLVASHPMLRACFARGTGGRTLVHIHESIPVPLTVTDICALPPREQDEAVGSALRAELAAGFNPCSPPLLRLAVHLRSPSTFQMTISFHHAIIDGWSDATLLTELFDHYLRLREGENHVLSRPRCSFADFVALEHEAVASAASAAFWSRFLQDVEPFRLAFEVSPEAACGHLRATRRTTALSEELGAALRRLANSMAVPLKTVLLTAHVRAMASLAATWDVVTCVVSSGRPEQVDSERAVGLFINSIPLRIAVKPTRWRDLIETVYETERTVLPHRRVPYSEIRQRRGGASISEVLFYFTDYHVYRSRERLGRIDVLDYLPHEVTSFPLTVSFSVDPRSRTIALELNADARRFTDAALITVETMLVETLAAMCGDCDGVCRSAALPSLRSGPETAAAPVERPNGVDTLAEMFMRCAERVPMAEALSDGQRSLSYAQLREQVGRVAAHLRTAGVGPEDPVIVLLGRCVALPAVLLGILQAGGVYVPIEPACPKDWLAELLAQFAGAPIVCDDTGRSLLAREQQARVLSLSSLFAEAPRSEGRRAIDHRTLACVLHTSGSTGRPKGVMTEHRALVNRLLWMQDAYGLTVEDRVLHKTPLGFDVSLWELLWPLLNGACLVIAPPDIHRDPRALAIFMARQRISVAHFVPGLLDLFLPETAELSFDRLRLLISSGEALMGETCTNVHRRLPSARLANLYGPTEAAIDVTAHDCRFEEPSSVPIGRAIANTAIRILDDDLLPVADGVAGELYIGGAPPARGYFGRSDLTADRFLPDPYGPPGSRLYRTGDLARRLADGEIRYCGRRDRQVKIGGVRIELGEIENALLRQPGITAACAHVWNEPAKRLVAYVVRRDPSLDGGMIAKALGRVLPRESVPSIAFLDALPVTATGKVDRARLPPPDRVGLRPYEAPSSPGEQRVAWLWEHVLGTGPVGRHDNFFARGGDSLALMRLASRIREEMGVVVPIRVLYECRDLATLALKVETAASAVGTPAAPTARLEGPLSLAQEGIWLAESRGVTPGTFHIPVFVRLAGELDVPALRQSLLLVAKRHPALRTRFEHRESGLRQFIMDHAEDVLSVDPPMHGIDDSGASLWAAQQACQPFELERGCWRARLLPGGLQRSYLLLVLHHIAADGWSVEIVLRDVAAIYGSLCQGAPISVVPLPADVVATANGERAESHRRLVEADVAWWEKRLAGVTASSPAADLPAQSSPLRSGARIPFAIPPQVGVRLRGLASAEGTTPFTILMSTFALLLYAKTGSSDLVIGMDFAGRDSPEAERAVGCFVTQLPVRIAIPANADFLDLVSRTGAELLDAYGHRAATAELVARRLARQNGATVDQLFKVKLVFQPQAPHPTPFGACAAIPLPLHLGGAKWDLLIDLWDLGETIEGALTYDISLYEPSTAERLAAAYVTLLHGAVERPSAALTSLLDTFYAAERGESAGALAAAEQSGLARLRNNRGNNTQGRSNDR
ncbi:non-ribosomal peptide synthetase [Sinorhizobium meliloti]|uniref:non-ribosomal peptide synthetase n=1 Tax=Rhizobium meliloti TaxID=382 RepID=UPI000FDC65AF|nr:non-ribosomal peptide synthetase [Sinorhizobium meliloti]RVK17007.1 amino acid adenylation domain-containing protein [Sinorhizobium meliloti]